MAENKKSNDVKLPIVKGKIANAITSAAKGHVVATTDDIYDTNFLEYQDEINKKVNQELVIIHDDVEVIKSDVSELKEDVADFGERIETIEGEVNAIQDDVAALKDNVSEIESKIPEEASSANQLADKEYVLNLIAKSSSYFRGAWANWESVPTDSEDYPKDTNGNRTPKLGDYMVIEDASDYSVESGLTGTWRFTYAGEWETDGKNGWVKEYQINEEPEVIISFFWNWEGNINEAATFITSKKVVKTDTLLSYPQLTENEFKDGGYWDTDITELRCVLDDVRVTFVIPISYNESLFDNQQLIELCYENGWCNSPEYMSLSEMENLTTTEN